ncbi:MAG: alpha-glucan family phosphorylase [Verrucomicrobiae bacterium]|nr:alpha-glucan family phosphorylase [Verrucomicrobiae bacterium]
MNLPFSFSVNPKLPEKLEPLRQLAYNMWWSWNTDARALFEELDPELWKNSGHSPATLLRKIKQNKLLRFAKDEGYLQQLNAVSERLQNYLARQDRWFTQTYPEQKDFLVAYFSAEFGFHESLQNYSGGLGILAGDHCKSASDLGVPLVGVGLMYRQGYFVQQLNKEGWQEAFYKNLDFHDLPVVEATDAEGKPTRVTVDLPGRQVQIGAWQATIGNVRVFFLDTDLPENTDADRKITNQLYGGDHEMRIQQEIVLGIGGRRFLKAMGLRPTVFHMNEGHAAFLALERIRQRMLDDQIDFYTALQTVAASTLFTTHTPVPAGNDAFSPQLMQIYFADYARDLKIDFEEFLKFGRPWLAESHQPFSMTILALRLSRFCNGVSKIHGGVSREMWQNVWFGVPVNEIPIGHITNGIHTQTWIAHELKELIQKQLGDCWECNLSNPEIWNPIYQIPDETLWKTHLQLKQRFVEFARKNIRNQKIRIQENARSVREVSTFLDPNRLTIGFARRFATYKRATLLFRDTERLARLVNHPDYPIQFVFAGKAHPADDGGKRLIQAIYQIANRPEFRGRIVFLENYDINVARHIYHGVDVWLNNPVPPLEASGTSGEKVAPNGVVNCSVLDGWWAEAWQRYVNGWAIGEPLHTHDPEVQNDSDVEALYALLEHEIAPLYYQRQNDIPKTWLQLMKNSIATITPTYSTFRQVQDYTNLYYVPSHQKGVAFEANHYEGAKALAEWKAQIRNAWPQIKITQIKLSTPSPVQNFTVGENFTLSAKVELGPLTHDNVIVEAYVESIDGYHTYVFAMMHQGDNRYEGVIEAKESGQYRYNIRVLPYHPLLVQKHELRLIKWAA